MQTEPHELNRSCAALVMYDWPEVSDYTDELWQLLSAVLQNAGIAVPARLERQRPVEDVWLDPELVLAQTCGFPYVAKLQAATTLLGTPEYAVDGASDGYYQSLLLTNNSESRVKPEDFTGSTLAINDFGSQSGFNSVRLYLAASNLRFSGNRLGADHPDQNSFFSQTLTTGSHRASLRAIAEQRADLCAVDPVSLALASDYDADVVARLRIIGRTPSVPALPLICSNQTAARIDLEALKRELHHCFKTLPEHIRKNLHLCGLRYLDDSCYDNLRDITRDAIARGYARLAPDHAPAEML